ncbi:MAG TPA: hypothetical protein VI424_12045 [Terriglobales bacterium]
MRGVVPVVAPGLVGAVVPGAGVVPGAPGVFEVPPLPVVELGVAAPLVPVPDVLPGVELGGGVAVPGAGVAVVLPGVVLGEALGLDGVLVVPLGFVP